MIRLVIPGEPCAKQRPRLGKGFVYTPVKTVNYETLIKELFIIGNYGKQLEGSLKIEVNAYFSIPKSTSKVKAAQMQNKDIRPIKKPDWDNIGKIVSDALNGLAYKDDSQIVTATVRKFYDAEPRIEVEIWEVSS